MPVTVEEYQIGQLFSVAEASKHNTGGGEGIEVLKNEAFNNFPLLGDRFKSGQYTYKVYHLASKAPGFIRLLTPKGAFEIHEEAWNAYPYCKTIVTNPKYMKGKFTIIIETMHANDKGYQENIHQLNPEKLHQREVIHIDIANDPILRADYKLDEDPTKYHSTKTGRGPLIGLDWKDKVVPTMTCYKLVTVEFKWFGLQTKVENFIHNSERRLFTIFNRQIFCWTDRWYGLTLTNIREIEEKTKAELDAQRQHGPVRGWHAETE